MQPVFKSIPALVSMVIFLLIYVLAVSFAFRPNERGRRRRWHLLDYIWVPLGGATGVCLLALGWRALVSL